MHFVTGGAFNGKRAWVKKSYLVQDYDGWISAYDHRPLPEKLEDDQDLLILEGIEKWLKGLSVEYEAKQCLEIWNSYLDLWTSWEKAKTDRKIVIIGTDITKGIVPMEAENRNWRDITGWAYQDLAKRSEQMDVIWYGLNQKIK
ncbi:bifunctional adenosylcobinamide kinase/adenosylcobinamide-phosphate guanylyltransferase [Paenibacillus sp. BSR1-1]|uniref:bifunctional adenosylcobinamide kinase/adenosylcobinamide-phosphate guanylyltransferase n=1 Tax=Paenibacillus sp. BSR1-1 TaxID=3020845 RepID=UPI0025AF65F0|nr:bifunctional adenosylcobinamide kinase/adenosylcobinamide-phosphate guanylyltransferase [Paenibacillus sp. BSR1-1]MDN3015271.1 bifunctional adenosylcobinamide kinase/adenosylcobinamide-phosphate guanylyltransferase [Paenibacillus sp. BSR1-1]